MYEEYMFVFNNSRELFLKIERTDRLWRGEKKKSLTMQANVYLLWSPILARD
jgi:hypothetical protein